MVLLPSRDIFLLRFYVQYRADAEILGFCTGIDLRSSRLAHQFHVYAREEAQIERSITSTPRRRRAYTTFHTTFGASGQTVYPPH